MKVFQRNKESCGKSQILWRSVVVNMHLATAIEAEGRAKSMLPTLKVNNNDP
jgi:hypothetical protein